MLKGIKKAFFSCTALHQCYMLICSLFTDENGKVLKGLEINFTCKAKIKNDRERNGWKNYVNLPNQNNNIKKSSK